MRIGFQKFNKERPGIVDEILTTDFKKNDDGSISPDFLGRCGNNIKKDEKQKLSMLVVTRNSLEVECQHDFFTSSYFKVEGNNQGLISKAKVVRKQNSLEAGYRKESLDCRI